MKSDIAAALELARDTEELIIDHGAIDQVAGLFTKHFGDAEAVVVADQNTYEAAGRLVHQALWDTGHTRLAPLVFPGEPRLVADLRRAVEVEEFLPHDKVIIVAVGAGTINDICKLAAYRMSKPYMSVATAASMDGYASANAPMVIDGFKHSLPCAAPLVVVADYDVLAKAPSFLAAAGYGDLLGKITSGADWILADSLGIESIDDTAWDMVQPRLDEWLGDPDAVAAGVPEVIAGLLEGLTMSGLSMQYLISSRPASGSEHQICHLWEMQGVEWEGEHVPHGFAVGMGTIASAAVYEKLLNMDVASLDISEVVGGWPSKSAVEAGVRQAIKNPEMLDRAIEETLAKYLSPSELRDRLEMVRTNWSDLVVRLRAQLQPSATIEEKLRRAGCPTLPQAFGLSWEDMRTSVDLARLVRRRYTVLDLAEEMGVFSSIVGGLFP